MFLFILKYILFIYFWPCCAACGTLVSQPGIEPVPPALQAQNLKCWIAREVPMTLFKMFVILLRSDSPSSQSLLIASLTQGVNAPGCYYF